MRARGAGRGVGAPRFLRARPPPTRRMTLMETPSAMPYPANIVSARIARDTRRTRVRQDRRPGDPALLSHSHASAVACAHARLCGVKVMSALGRGDGPWPADTDCLSHFAQVVVQLMIPPGQLVHLRLRDGRGIQVNMRGRGRLVAESVEHIHPRTWRQLGAEVARQLELVAEPAALADERSGDQHNRPKPFLRRLLGQRMEEDCRAYRMADHDRAVVQGRHLPANRRTPPGITRVALVRHARVADLVLTPESSPQTLDQLVVPLVVRARAAALDEQDLPGTSHGDPLPRLRDHSNRYPPLAGVYSGQRQVPSEATMGLPRTSHNAAYSAPSRARAGCPRPNTAPGKTFPWLPEVATGQATPSGRRTTRCDLARSAATLVRPTASDRRDGDTQRYEGRAERDHRALAPAGNDAEPPPSSLPPYHVPGFPTTATSPAAQLSPDARPRTADTQAADTSAPDRGVTRCQRHSPSLSARTASIFSLTLRDAEGGQERSPSRDPAGQDGLDAIGSGRPIRSLCAPSQPDLHAE